MKKMRTGTGNLKSGAKIESNIDSFFIPSLLGRFFLRFLPSIRFCVIRIYFFGCFSAILDNCSYNVCAMCNFAFEITVRVTPPVPQSLTENLN